MLNFKQAFIISLGSIKSAKLRSSLTTLGIIIGIAAVVANVSLGESFNVYFAQQINAQGSNFIIVYSQEPNIFYDNELQIIDKTPGVAAVSPIKQQLGQVTYFSQTKNFNIYGVTKDYQDTSNIIMQDGSFLTNQDEFSAVIGEKIANEKFKRNITARSSIDITLRINGNKTVTRTFKVKGIIKPLAVPSFSSGAPDRDTIVFVPIATINQMLEQNDYSAFVAMSDKLEDVEKVSNAIDKRLARNFGVSERDINEEDTKPYRIFNEATILKQLNQLANALGSFLVVVALISLIVGSIGIMNIMLVTVTERTREIGIMKALGFSSMDILFLFLVESVIISLLGGFLGLCLGISGAYIVTTFLKLPFFYSSYLFVLGFVVAIVVGVFAGIYPARKAARLVPVEALRYQ